ncbi:sulfotransferase family protein [Nocardioides ferulae]|uniref:sulfotransferase family protein n=1 Tax=Nocardioides ferulae TaxID=2340821 RepID=UPI0013DDC27F|nr:sulfotransferase family protein [Nocardioides ferulae]
MPEYRTGDAEPEVTETDLAMATTPPPADGKRRAVFVAGSGRSGTSLMSGILKHLGLHVPEPEVVADTTNPKGFGEPQWVVDFHEQLLRRANVGVGDARPDAWFDTGRVGLQEAHRAALSDWLDQQFGTADALVIKDPRLSWFLAMWQVAAVRAGATTATVTMLRPPPEVVGSKNTYYGGRLGDISRLAGWVNVMLCTERATRGSNRSFVRYHDLLTDWTSSVVRVGEELGVEQIALARMRDMREVHEFVDPSLRRVRATWDDLSVPRPLREIAEAAWEQLNLLAEPGEDRPEVHAALDDLRRGYAAMYAEAEALVDSSIVAAGPAYARAQRQARAAAAAREAEQQEAATPKGPAVQRARRAAGRVKRRLQGQ